MWVWVPVGVAAYALFVAAVVVVLRAAKARGARERATDAGMAPGPPTEPADGEAPRGHPEPPADPECGRDRSRGRGGGARSGAARRKSPTADL